MKKNTSRSQKVYYVYILLCGDGSYYTGYTSNIGLRVRQHNEGSGARYTRMHRLGRLVYAEKFSSRREAMSRERKIKAMSHDQKNQLINSSRNLIM